MKTLKMYRMLLLILVVINIVTLCFLLLRPDHPHLPPDRINIAEKLGIKGQKEKEVNRIQQNHHKEMHRLNDQIKQLHDQLYRVFLKDNEDSTKAKELVNAIAENHRKIAFLLYAYFDELKTYCNAEQRERLNEHFEEVIQRDGPPSRHKR